MHFRTQINDTDPAKWRTIEADSAERAAIASIEGTPHAADLKRGREIRVWVADPDCHDNGVPISARLCIVWRGPQVEGGAA